jgi:hypothetical protein
VNRGVQQVGERRTREVFLQVD